MIRIGLLFGRTPERNLVALSQGMCRATVTADAELTAVRSSSHM